MQRFSYKLLSLAALIFLICALLIIIDTGPATGYEISIYSAYPPCFWFFIIGSLVIGLCIILFQAFSDKPSQWWTAGLGIVLVSNTLLLLLPFFRGYFVYDLYGMGSTDNLRHLGYAKDIQLDGHFYTGSGWGQNFYPAVHILMVSLSYLTNIDTRSVLPFLPPLFFIFYIISIYLFARELTQDRRQWLLVTVFGSLPVLGNSYLTFLAHNMTFFMLPFFLFLYYRSMTWQGEQIAYMTAFLLMIVALVSYHPLSGGIWLLIVFLCLIVSSWLDSQIRFGGINRSPPSLTANVGLWYIPMILITIWFLWFPQFDMFQIGVEGIWQSMRGIGTSEASLSAASGNYFIPALPIFEVLVHTIKSLGSRAVYLLTAALCIFILWRKSRLEEKNFFNPNLKLFFILYTVFSVLVIVTFFISFATAFGRPFSYAVFASSIIIGMALGTLLRKAPKLSSAILTVILLLSIGMGVFSIYMSPEVSRANPQVTFSDIRGMSWFLDNRNETLLTDETFATQLHMAEATTGIHYLPANLRESPDACAPDHFGYFDYDTYGAPYNEDRYFLSNKLARMFYRQVLPEDKNVWRWTPEDYEHLEDDPTVSRIYRSREFEVFYVSGVAYE